MVPVTALLRTGVPAKFKQTIQLLEQELALRTASIAEVWEIQGESIEH